MSGVRKRRSVVPARMLGSLEFERLTVVKVAPPSVVVSSEVGQPVDGHGTSGEVSTHHCCALNAVTPTTRSGTTPTSDLDGLDEGVGCVGDSAVGVGSTTPLASGITGAAPCHGCVTS